jgi:two-component system, cell cycle response regulator DivK
LKKILIVEDNQTNLKLYHMILHVMQVDICDAVTGEEGVIKANEIHPDLILMDIQLPGIDGIETFHKIRSNPSIKQIPIIAITSYAMKGDREQLLSIGFNAYLAKPISKNQFTQVILQFLT